MNASTVYSFQRYHIRYSTFIWVFSIQALNLNNHDDKDLSMEVACTPSIVLQGDKEKCKQKTEMLENINELFTVRDKSRHIWRHVIVRHRVREDIDGERLGAVWTNGCGENEE